MMLQMMIRCPCWLVSLEKNSKPSKSNKSSDVEILKKLNATGQISKIDKRIYTFLSSFCNDESKKEVEILKVTVCNQGVTIFKCKFYYVYKS